MPQRETWAMEGFGGGVDFTTPSHVLSGQFSPDAENFDPSVTDVLQKRKGTNNFSGNHGSPTGTLVRGLCAYTYEDGTSKILAKEGTAVYDITGGNWSTAITGHPALGDADEVHFAMLRNLLVMVSEEASPIAPQKWTGSGTFANLSGSPPLGKYICVHAGRLFIACTASDPSRVYYSAINAPEDWSTTNDAGNFYCFPGDGMNINGIASDGEVLYISKVTPGGYSGAIYAVFGTGPSTFTPPQRISWFGAYGHRAMGLTNSFVAAATQVGIVALQGRTISVIGEPVNGEYLALTDAQRANTCIGMYKDQLWVGYTSTGSTNNKAFVLDIPSGRWSRYSNINSRAFATSAAQVLYGASSSSTVRVAKMDTDNTDIGTTAITMYWATPKLSFGSWANDKKLVNSYYHFDSQAVTWTITRSYDGAAYGDSQTKVGNTSGEAPVQRLIATQADSFFRFVQIKISEADTSLQGRAFGMAVKADVMERER